jgi:hypothetical protein
LPANLFTDAPARAVLLQFYPSSSITLAYSVIEASIAISQIIAAPVAAGLLQLSGVWGLAGEAHRGRGAQEGNQGVAQWQCRDNLQLA